MKRYVMEMENDFERKLEKRSDLTKEQKHVIFCELVRIRNAYYCGIVTEIDAIRSMLKAFQA